MWPMIYVFIVGFAESRLPKGSISFHFLSHLTKKIAPDSLNSCIFVGIGKFIGQSHVASDLTELRVVAQRSHSPCSALLDPSTTGDIREKKCKVAPTPRD